MTTDVFIRLPEVKRSVSISRSEIYRRMRAGEFPRPVKIGVRAVAWTRSSIQSWIDARIRESRDGGGAK